MSYRSRALFVAVPALCLVAAALFAGPLDPPAGPVSPTYKTLQEVEPRIPIGPTTTPGDSDSVYRIAAPGSYYLTGNLTGQVAKSGIEIAASNVTIDLRGFALQGVTGSLDGITINSGGTGSNAVMNGSVSGWGDDGVDFGTIATVNSRILDLRVRLCTGVAIVAGTGTEVSRCVCTSNTGIGITTSICCSVSDCVTYANTGGGISAGSGCTVTRCTAYNNGAIGISASGSSTIVECTSVSNDTMGIFAGTGSTISRCTSRANTGDGINVSSACQVRDNTCSFNGAGTGDAANIHASGSDNRIEGNLCTSADRGIEAGNTGNFISRNVCSGNTSANWEIAAGNFCLVVVGVPAAAISGNNGGTAPGSTDPNANFTY